LSDILKLSAAFLVMIALIRRKHNVGVVLIAASAVIFGAYRMGPVAIGGVLYDAATSMVGIKLLLALTFIRMLEIILREQNVFKKMMATIEGYLKNRRCVIISMPLLIGMMPSVGGAHFSCPMVEESTNGLGLSREDKAFTNYWFRHPWEMILPVYPGVVLASVIAHVELRAMIAMNMAVAAAFIAAGFLFSMKGVRGDTGTMRERSPGGFLSFIPIAALLLMVMAAGLEPHTALMLLVFSLMLYYRHDAPAVVRVLKYGFAKDVLLLIAGVLLFKEGLEASGAVKNLSVFLVERGIPLTSLLILPSFISGLLMGITIGFVGAVFPLLINLPGTDAHAVALAFAAGYVGVLLSPVHVCLILTREYFKADLWGIYKRIIPASMVIFAVALAQYFLYRLPIR
jgi:hypothetical protein